MKYLLNKNISLMLLLISSMQKCILTMICKVMFLWIKAVRMEQLLMEIRFSRWVPVVNNAVYMAENCSHMSVLHTLWQITSNVIGRLLSYINVFLGSLLYLGPLKMLHVWFILGKNPLWLQLL